MTKRIVRRTAKPERTVIQLKALIGADYNPRAITDAQREGLKTSLDTFGYVQDIIVNRRLAEHGWGPDDDGQMIIVGGHQRRAELVDLGFDSAEVTVVEVGPTAEKAANLTLNNPNIAGDFTDGAADLLADLAASPMDDLFGDLRLDVLDEDLCPTPPKKPKEDPGAEPPPVEAFTKPGDLWCLGGHRVLCGDCREGDDVDYLMNGEPANVAFTSPPYASQRKYDESSGFKPIPPDEYGAWFEAVQENIRRVLAADGSWFLNMKEHYRVHFTKLLAR